MKKTIALFFVLSIFFSIKAQDTTINKIVLLPLISNGIDLASVQTAESILRMELSNASTMNVVSEKKTLTALGNEDCADEECAKQIGEKLDAKQVLLCKLNPLGEKIIVQYILVETATGKNLLSESATAINLEDIDAVMKRVAISVSKQTPFNTNQEVGNIVGKESIESLRQKARYNFGVGFGYLFPSYGYDADKKSFTINLYFDYEIQDYAVGLMIGARKGFAINLYGNYLFSRTDISPYLGGSLGFHWVSSHENMWVEYSPYPTNTANKDEDGIELGLQAGIRLFHTYNFQLFVQGEYIMTFNDYNDKAFVFTIGIL
jgi:TolB-like protein